MRVAIARLFTAYHKHIIKVIVAQAKRSDDKTLKQHAGVAGLHSAWSDLKRQSGVVATTKKVADLTAASVVKQLSTAIDVGDEWNPDLEAEAIAYSERVVGGLEEKSAVSIERAQDILDEWDGDDLDELSDKLDEGLDGVTGGALAWAALAFGDMFADKNKGAQEDAGVSSYTWLSMNDSHVRPAHAALDGETADWDDPPLKASESDNGEDDHPGQDFGCRCIASPNEPDDEALPN